jgi:hypothetical protein
LLYFTGLKITIINVFVGIGMEEEGVKDGI